LAGLGGAAYGFGKSGLFGAADGGLMESYAEGGVTSQQNIENILTKLSDQQLAQAKEAALNRRDVQEAQMIDAELAERASIRNGLGNAFNQIPIDQQEAMMADGGIVAFAKGGDTYGNQFESSIQALRDLSGQQPAPQTPEELEQGAMNRLPMLERMMGPDVTQKYMEETQAKRAGLADQFDKDKWAAFAMSSLGMLARKRTPGESQANQFISGLGEAGQQFVGEVSRLKKENREVDDKLRQSEILLATAQQQRKEGMANKAIASEEKAADQRQAAFKQKTEIQEKVAQLQGGMAQAEMHAKSAEKVAGITAASHRYAADKPGQLQQMVRDYEQRIGRKLTADEMVAVTEKMGAAMYGSKYTGPDKTPEQASAITKQARETGPVKALELPLLQAQQSGDPVKIQAAQDAYARALRAAEQDIIDQAERARALKREERAGNVPGGTGTPSRSGRDVSGVGITPPPEAVDILKKDPSTVNRTYFDKHFGAGAAARGLGN